MKNLDALPKNHNYSQGIVHDRAARGHTTVLDTGSQQSMVGIGGWEIIKHHEMWIYTQGITIGGSSKAGFCLQLVDERGVVKIAWIESAT